MGRIRTKPSIEDVQAQKEKLLGTLNSEGGFGEGTIQEYNYFLYLKRAAHSRVYFVQMIMPDGSAGSIKIGVSKDIQARVSILQGACPFDLKVLGVAEGYRDVDAGISWK